MPKYLQATLAIALLIVSAGCGSNGISSHNGIPAILTPATTVPSAQPSTSVAPTTAPVGSPSISPTAISTQPPIAVTSPSVAPIVPSQQPTTVPTATATSLPTVMPTSIVTLAPTAIPTTSATTTPTTQPTVAPPIMIFTPSPIVTTPAPAPTSVATVTGFSTGLISSGTYPAFNGNLQITYPIPNAAGNVHIDSFSGFPNYLPQVAGGSSVDGLLYFTTGNNPSFDANRTMSIIYTPTTGTPTGQFHVAFYRPQLDSVNGWYTGFGTSTISNGIVTLTFSLPSALPIFTNGGGGQIYFALTNN